MFNKFKINIIILSILILGTVSVLSAEEKNYKIIKLVNEYVITNYDLEQRIKLYSILNRVAVNKENIDKIANEMLSVMVDEALQLEQINKYNVVIDSSNIDDYIKNRYFRVSIFSVW